MSVKEEERTYDIQKLLDQEYKDWLSKAFPNAVKVTEYTNTAQVSSENVQRKPGPTGTNRKRSGDVRTRHNKRPITNRKSMERKRQYGEVQRLYDRSKQRCTEYILS
jgi:hypothetical protein